MWVLSTGFFFSRFEWLLVCTLYYEIKHFYSFTWPNAIRVASSSSKIIWLSERTFCGLQPHPGNGSPSSPMGHGASSPGTPWSPLSPLSPFRPFLPTGPWNTINNIQSVSPTVAHVRFVAGFTPCERVS